jgi:hypothetical protein
MIVCCNREMKVQKNGVGVEAGSTIFPADRYVCLVCLRTVLLTQDDASGARGEGIDDQQHELFSEYVVLK